MKSSLPSLPSIFVISALVCFLSLSVAPGKTLAEETKANVQSLTDEALEKKWGVRPLSVRQTADGHMLDFRYRVVDEQKAAPLFSPKIKPLLVDENTGAVMAVPNVPKVGSMRSTRKPVRDRTYFMLFANPQKHIQPGHKVTVVIGDCRVEHLVVE
jgi:hypothetical protein